MARWLRRRTCTQWTRVRFPLISGIRKSIRPKLLLCTGKVIFTQWHILAVVMRECMPLERADVRYKVIVLVVIVVVVVVFAHTYSKNSQKHAKGESDSSMWLQSSAIGLFQKQVVSTRYMLCGAVVDWQRWQWLDSYSLERHWMTDNYCSRPSKHSSLSTEKCFPVCCLLDHKTIAVNSALYSFNTADTVGWVSGRASSLEYRAVSSGFDWKTCEEQSLTHDGHGNRLHMHTHC